MAEAIDFPLSFRKLDAGSTRKNDDLLFLNDAVIRNCYNSYVFIITKISLRLNQSDMPLTL